MPLAFSLDQQRVAFRQHLDELRNQRVIFSGAGGVRQTQSATGQLVCGLPCYSLAAEYPPRGHPPPFRP